MKSSKKTSVYGESDSQLRTSDSRLILFTGIGRFPERLRIVIGDTPLRAFAKQIQVSEGTLRNYLAGNSEPDLTVIGSICNQGDVNVAWLVAGEGEMRPGEEVNVNNAGQKTQESPSFDSDLMRQIIEGVEMGLDEAGLMQPPGGKAQFILKLYEWFVKARPENPRQEVIDLFTKGHKDAVHGRKDPGAAPDDEGDPPKR